MYISVHHMTVWIQGITRLNVGSTWDEIRDKIFHAFSWRHYLTNNWHGQSNVQNDDRPSLEEACDDTVAVVQTRAATKIGEKEVDSFNMTVKFQQTQVLNKKCGRLYHICQQSRAIHLIFKYVSAVKEVRVVNVAQTQWQSNVKVIRFFNMLRRLFRWWIHVDHVSFRVQTV